jgi:hypothetical protein
VWASCGLNNSFAPGPAWQRFAFSFRAQRTCSTASRFQIWFTSTGTLWVDDASFVEAPAECNRPGHVIAAGQRTNLVPNASFECGTSAWGSAEGDRVLHWGGRMNRLFGAIDTAEAHDGASSLTITLTPETQPVSFFDYFDLRRTPIRAPLAGNVGYLEVEPGRKYTLSAYLKARSAGTPALLAVRQFEGRGFERVVVCAAAGVPPAAIRVEGTGSRILDIMGRPAAESRFVPDGTLVYVVASGMTPEEFEAAVLPP